MAQFRSAMTAWGTALIAGTPTGGTITFSAIAIGDGYLPSDLSTVTTLGNEQARYALTSSDIGRDGNDVWARAAVNPVAAPYGYFLREMALYAIDPAYPTNPAQAKIYAVCCVEDDDGSGRDYYMVVPGSSQPLFLDMYAQIHTIISANVNISVINVLPPGDVYDLINDIYVQLTDIRNIALHGGFYGYCTTALATSAKTVAIPNFLLKAGITKITIRFRYGIAFRDTALTLNVSGSGAIPIQSLNALYEGPLPAYTIVTMVYVDGVWRITSIDGDYNRNSYTSLANIGLSETTMSTTDVNSNINTIISSMRDLEIITLGLSVGSILWESVMRSLGYDPSTNTSTFRLTMHRLSATYVHIWAIFTSGTTWLGLYRTAIVDWKRLTDTTNYRALYTSPAGLGISNSEFSPSDAAANIYKVLDALGAFESINYGTTLGSNPNWWQSLHDWLDLPASYTQGLRTTIQKSSTNETIAFITVSDRWGNQWMSTVIDGIVGEPSLLPDARNLRFTMRSLQVWGLSDADMSPTDMAANVYMIVQRIAKGGDSFNVRLQKSLITGSPPAETSEWPNLHAAFMAWMAASFDDFASWASPYVGDLTDVHMQVDAMKGPSSHNVQMRFYPNQPTGRTAVEYIAATYDSALKTPWPVINSNDILDYSKGNFTVTFQSLSFNGTHVKPGRFDIAAVGKGIATNGYVAVAASSFNAGNVIAGLPGSGLSALTITADGIPLPDRSVLLFRHTPGGVGGAGTLYYFTDAGNTRGALRPNDVILLSRYSTYVKIAGGDQITTTSAIESGKFIDNAKRYTRQTFSSFAEMPGGLSDTDMSPTDVNANLATLTAAMAAMEYLDILCTPTTNANLRSSIQASIGTSITTSLRLIIRRASTATQITPIEVVYLNGTTYRASFGTIISAWTLASGAMVKPTIWAGLGGTTGTNLNITTGLSKTTVADGDTFAFYALGTATRTTMTVDGIGSGAYYSNNAPGNIDDGMHTVRYRAGIYYEV